MVREHRSARRFTSLGTFLESALVRARAQSLWWAAETAAGAPVDPAPWTAATLALELEMSTYWYHYAGRATDAKLEVLVIEGAGLKVGDDDRGGTAMTLLPLRGRIDRIDYHESLGRLCVLDYKTADRGQPPDKTHRRGGEWRSRAWASRSNTS